MDEVVFCLPSHRRPHRLADVMQACVDMQTKAQIDILIDDDDPCRAEYERLTLPPFALLIPTPNRGQVTGSMNKTFEAHPHARCYGLLCDDTIPRTICWDQGLAYAAGRWNVAWPDDLCQGRKLSTLPVVGGDLVRAIGWFGLPGTKRIYMDATWHEIGRLYGVLRYCPGIIVEHMVPRLGKAEIDFTWHKPEKGEDEATFNNWKSEYVKDRRIVDAISQAGLTNSSMRSISAS